MSPDVVARNGHLRFPRLRKSDEGTYLCTAVNSAGDIDTTVHVYVREQRYPPVIEEVSVAPTEHTGAPGEEIRLRCTPSHLGRAVWSKIGSVELPQNVEIVDDELVIRFSVVDDTGRYVCTVEFPSGVTRTASSNVVVYAKSTDQTPRISVLERKYTVVQGSDFELTCEAAGVPYPTVTWSLVKN